MELSGVGEGGRAEQRSRPHRAWITAAVMPLVAVIVLLWKLQTPAGAGHTLFTRSTAIPSAPSAPSAPISTALPPPHLGYGGNVRLPANIPSLFDPLGMEWIKLWEEYAGSPPDERLPYQVLFVVDLREGVPADLNAWGDHIETIARAGRGRVEAYEIGNEPNAARFWGGRPPDPAEYVRLLAIAYTRIKAVDSSAIIVSAGLAPVGRIEGTCRGDSGALWEGNNCDGMDEQEYARQMLAWGGGEYFDAFGYHPYGFAYPPETDPQAVSNGFAFRSAETMHAILSAYGEEHTPIWATEFNWLRDWTEDGGMPSHCLGQYESIFGWMEVSGEEQANYITRAYQYADRHWPWMGAMFVWNLDWHTYHLWDCEAARYFALRRNDGSVTGETTPAYQALLAMEKRPGHFGPRLAITPTSVTLLADVRSPALLTATLLPWNAGYRVLTWTASARPHLAITPTLVPTGGLQGVSLTVQVGSSGYAVGVFTGCITISTTSTDVLDVPRTVPVTLTVARFSPRLALWPSRLVFLADVRTPQVLTGIVVPTNTGFHVLTWTASVVSGFAVTGTSTLGTQVTPTLVTTTGLQGEPLIVSVDTTGYSSGTFIGSISVAADPTDTLDAPQTLPVILQVVPQIQRVHLPVVLRGARVYARHDLRLTSR